MPPKSGKQNQHYNPNNAHQATTKASPKNQQNHKQNQATQTNPVITQ